MGVSKVGVQGGPHGSGLQRRAPDKGDPLVTQMGTDHAFKETTQSFGANTHKDEKAQPLQLTYSWKQWVIPAAPER